MHGPTSLGEWIPTVFSLQQFFLTLDILPVFIIAPRR